MSEGSKPRSIQSHPSSQVRQEFIDFFAERDHARVPSASLVPGEDGTLLFTNAGMVQFKDVFLGTGTRPYSRAVNSQKCMRVAGKHNDLDDVGRDDTHHTFFEMLGNWSFGDYYKQEAIGWAWELLTDVWGLEGERLYATCFEDELGQIERDDEAAGYWRQQPGFRAENLLFFGRDENFWEMADTGPCGPDSEIHYDQGPQYCDKQAQPGHVCQVNGDCARFLELWNLVFIQYNRTSPTNLEPLPEKHVDTGMGFERIVSVLQGVDSNYQTDLFLPLIARVQEMAGHSDDQRAELITPYRVIADHSRAAAFLIADGVVPGNGGRNYICRMIIRRASRFGSYTGFVEPFLGKVAEVVIQEYGHHYPELNRHKSMVMDTITEEERRFQRTVEAGVHHLEDEFEVMEGAGSQEVAGQTAFDLYATYGLPLEITRDIARERGLGVDEVGFRNAMEAHREISASSFEAEEVLGAPPELFARILKDLQAKGALGEDGIEFDPYRLDASPAQVLALVRDGKLTPIAEPGDTIGVVLPETHFFVESGGQVSDKGFIYSARDSSWEIEVQDVRRPASGIVVHVGVVKSGTPSVGDSAIAAVDDERRMDIMRNHTATHLLHAALRGIVGEHARQAGSLVAPDRLRFDFTHSKSLTRDQIRAIETWVNVAILRNLPLVFKQETRERAASRGAMALFGETYGEQVRTVSIGEDDPISYELCGGTHVSATGVIGPFLIMSESSTAAGIRRIEAITGRAAMDHIRDLRDQIQRLADRLEVAPDELPKQLDALLEYQDRLRREQDAQLARLAAHEYSELSPQMIDGVAVLTGEIPSATSSILRQLADRFRQEHGSGVIVLASQPKGSPLFVGAVTEDLVARGLHAGQLIQQVAEVVGGGGGGRPTLAQAGGRDSSAIPQALAVVPGWVERHLAQDQT